MKKIRLIQEKKWSFWNDESNKIITLENCKKDNILLFTVNGVPIVNTKNPFSSIILSIDEKIKIIGGYTIIRGSGNGIIYGYCRLKEDYNNITITIDWKSDSNYSSQNRNQAGLSICEFQNVKSLVYRSDLARDFGRGTGSIAIDKKNDIGSMFYSFHGYIAEDNNTMIPNDIHFIGKIQGQMGSAYSWFDDGTGRKNHTVTFSGGTGQYRIMEVLQLIPEEDEALYFFDENNEQDNLPKYEDFLKELDSQNLQTYYAKIVVLNHAELPIREITGQITAGSISINGSSAVRRTCNLTFLADEYENDLTNINSLLSINKKIKVMVGIENNININFDKIIWLPQGIFVINQPSISHGTNGVTISLSCKDKMCLLNGECGGNLPAPVVFDSYDQLLEDGSRVSIPQTMFHIIQTLVANYGGEAMSKIFINDLPLETKQIVRYTGSAPLFYDSENNFYTTDQTYVEGNEGQWTTFGFNENIGYIYTDFVYPGSLQSGIGDNICSVLDKIKNALGNYEYFYDIDGNFVFQEIKNYLNNSYDPVDIYRLDNNRKVEMASNNLTILDNVSYQVDFNSNTKVAYDFDEKTGLISSYSNAPVYSNIKNDFHIWGKNSDDLAIHYHIAIKNKPTEMNSYYVVFLKDETGEYTGALRLATADEIKASSYTITEETLNNNEELGNEIANSEVYVNNDNSTYVTTSTETLNLSNNVVELYTPIDWRAELYLRGLSKQANDIRPDIYEQELLDLFDAIYDFRAKQFKVDTVNNPNALNYWFDYLQPSAELFDISVDSLYPKIYSYQQDNIVRLYNNDVPDVILIDVNEDFLKREAMKDRCEREGQPFANIDSVIYSNLATSVLGYAAQETARELLYQYTHYAESITLQSRPIYHLEPNTRISVVDRKSGIKGDYIIKTISLPLDAKNMMNISATKALDRI